VPHDGRVIKHRQQPEGIKKARGALGGSAAVMALDPCPVCLASSVLVLARREPGSRGPRLAHLVRPYRCFCAECLSGFDVDRRYARRLSVRLRSGAGLSDDELAHLISPTSRASSGTHLLHPRTSQEGAQNIHTTVPPIGQKGEQQ
jgi:hypothetical protein